MSGPKKPRRDPLLEAADALDAGTLTHEQIRLMFSPHAKAAATQKDLDVGGLIAAGLGAAQGMSFGLGDVVRRNFRNRGGALSSPEEEQVIAATIAQHPYLNIGGLLTGGAIPFLATGGESAAALPGLGVRGSQTAIGAAQGFGLTPGNATERTIGAAAGAAGARYAPEIAQGVGNIASKLPLLGPMIRQARGIQAGSAVQGPISESIVDPDAALRTTLSKVFKPQDLDAAVAAAKKGQLRQMIPQAPPDPLEVATAIRRGTMEPSTAGTRGYRPAGPKTSKPGKPIWYGSGSPTKSAAVRGGERLLPDPRPGALLRQTPFQTLQATLREPSTPQIVKDAILQEIQRRGIVGEGLLPPLQR